MSRRLTPAAAPPPLLPLRALRPLPLRRYRAGRAAPGRRCGRARPGCAPAFGARSAQRWAPGWGAACVQHPCALSPVASRASRGPPPRGPNPAAPTPHLRLWGQAVGVAAAHVARLKGKVVCKIALVVVVQASLVVSSLVLARPPQQLCGWCAGGRAGGGGWGAAGQAGSSSTAAAAAALVDAPCTNGESAVGTPPAFSPGCAPAAAAQPASVAGAISASRAARRVVGCLWGARGCGAGGSAWHRTRAAEVHTRAIGASRPRSVLWGSK